MAHGGDRYNRYVLLDRDGVINVERGDYTTTREEWEWAPGALEGLKLLKNAGFGVVFATIGWGGNVGLYREAVENIDSLEVRK